MFSKFFLWIMINMVPHAKEIDSNSKMERDIYFEMIGISSVVILLINRERERERKDSAVIFLIRRKIFVVILDIQ